MTKQEIKDIITDINLNVEEKAVKIMAFKRQINFEWLVVLILFCVIFVGYSVDTHNVVDNTKELKEVIRKQDSILTLQKNQLDTLVWYNEIGFKIK